ncbi:hypothetical protein BH10PAT3_BH10PAT3_3440 [soil metagenome]
MAIDIEKLLDSPAAETGAAYYTERHNSTAHVPYNTVRAIASALDIYGTAMPYDAVMFVEGAEAAKRELGAQNV